MLADVPLRHFDRGLSLEKTFRRYMPGEPPPAGIPWLWTGWVDSNGYGKMAHNGRSYWAHRLSYSLFRGEIPTGMFVLHLLDIPLDVNPWNLQIGTHTDNMEHMKSRGRSNRHPIRGVDNGLARLTEDDVLEIRRLYATGTWTQSALGERFGVTREAAREVIHRRTWTHL